MAEALTSSWSALMEALPSYWAISLWWLPLGWPTHLDSFRTFPISALKALDKSRGLVTRNHIKSLWQETSTFSSLFPNQDGAQGKVDKSRKKISLVISSNSQDKKRDPSQMGSHRKYSAAVHAGQEHRFFMYSVDSSVRRVSWRSYCSSEESSQMNVF